MRELSPRFRPNRPCFLAGWVGLTAVAYFAIAGPVFAAKVQQMGEGLVGIDVVNELPGGKEADGIIGDFLMVNDRVEAVISNDAPLRRANMSTFYGEDGITPGCLYDLTLRGANNDQLTIFAPFQQKGPVTSVRIAAEGKSGPAIVETVVSAAEGGGLYRKHEYILEDGWQGVMVVTTLRNETEKPRSVTLKDVWTNFKEKGTFAGVMWGDAIDPADKAGYASAKVPYDGLTVPESTVELASWGELKYARFVAVGTSPAEAFGIVAALRGETVEVTGRILGPDKEPVKTAGVAIAKGAAKVVAYPDDESGEFSVELAPGKYTVTVEDIGRPSIEKEIEVVKGEAQTVNFAMEAVSAIAFDVRDAGGAGIPCKAQFIGIEGTESPNLGPQNRAHGCLNQYHSEKGEFRVPVPPGTYRVVVTRGIEFAHHEEKVVIAAGETATVKAKLERLVDTKGWVSTDFHNHSTPSGDNTCGTDDRVINLAAEHIEFAPTTEHNRIYDWAPHIARLGLAEEISTISGIELTGRGAHFNAFPFEPQPRRQDGGAPSWQKDPRLNAIVLRDFQGPSPHRWIQINHPDMVENFTDRDGDGRADGGYMTLGSLINAVETQNYRDSSILAGAPFRLGGVPGSGIGYRVDYIREFVWLQLLNQGHRIWGVAVCDAHSVFGNGVGGWRTYVPSRSDAPAKIDWREIVTNSQAGRMILTTGPFLEVTAGDGTIAGGDTHAAGSIALDVRVQCTDWIDIDRVQVLVNGRQEPGLNFTRAKNPDAFADGVVKFEKTINVPLSQDSHLIVVAIGENFDLSTGYGNSGQAKIRPCAYNNPIYVDVDGGGFTANGDTLGYDLPVKQMTVDTAKGILEAKGLNELIPEAKR